MINTKVFITTSAFTLALAGALVSNSEESQLTSYNGYDFFGACVVTAPPIERNCGLLNVGDQCTVVTDPGTWDEYNTPAWLSLSLLPTCLLVLRAPLP